MITFKMDMPGDFGEQIRKELESKLREHLRKDGLSRVTVRLDSQGRASFYGSDEDLKLVEKSLEKWR